VRSCPGFHIVLANGESKIPVSPRFTDIDLHASDRFRNFALPRGSARAYLQQPAHYDPDS
jgi:hypothetical protein